MILAGRLADWSVADLLQIMRITNKTGSLEIEGPMRKGVIYFREGKIVGARLDPTGPDRPEQDLRDAVIETVYVLQLLQEGTFAVGDLEIDDVEVDWDPPEILEAAQSQLEVEDEIRRDGIDDDTPLRLVRQVSEPVMLTPDEWVALSDLTSSFSLAELEWRLGRTRAVSAIRSFRAAGVIEITEDRAPVSSSPPTAPPSPTPSSSAAPPPAASPPVSSSPVEESGSLPVEAVEAVEPAVSGDSDMPPAVGSAAESESAPVLTADDEARLLAEASGRVEVHLVDDEEDLDPSPSPGSAPKKDVRGVVSEETVLVPGVLSELNRRFRLPEDQED